MFASIIAHTHAANPFVRSSAAHAAFPPRPVRVILLGLLTWLAAACKGDSTAPAGMHAQTPSAHISVEACASDCTLLDGVAPFQRTRADQDSIAAFVYVGDVTVQGATGGTLSVSLVSDASLMSALAADSLVVIVNGSAQAIPIDDFAAGPVVVHRFAGPQTIVVEYRLTGHIPGALPPAAVRLVQHTVAATVTASNRPWVRTRSLVRSDGIPPGGGTLPPPDCPITMASQTFCGGITVQVSPFTLTGAGGGPIGGTFQSAAGTGASSPITITFSPAVTSATIMAYDPTYPGNGATAYDSLGSVVATGTFLYSGTPGLNQPNSVSLTAGGISKIVLSPAPADYVSYDVTFVGDSCASVQDSLLDNEGVRDSLQALMARSNPNATPGTGQKKERQLWVYTDGNGHYQTREVVDPNATECTVNELPAPFIGANWMAVAHAHTHPSNNGELTYGCLDQNNSTATYTQYPNDGKAIPDVKPDDPAHGGGSIDDWSSTHSGWDEYVITKSGNVYRLTPQYSDPANWSKNPYKYTINGRCIVPQLSPS